MVAYADTSFLYSLYGHDANSAEARTTGSALNAPLALTPLQRHELRNAFRLAVFRKAMTEEQCVAVLNEIDADIRTGVLLETHVSWAEVYSESDKLSTAHTLTLGTRGFDILHVACAITLGIKNFLTFDNRQKSLAANAGLEIGNH
jgi:predicted nucleic acid-binding protein